MCKYNYVLQWTVRLNFVCLCVKVITHRIEMHHYPGEHMSEYCRRATQLWHRTHDHWPVATQDAPRTCYLLLKGSFLCMFMPFHIQSRHKKTSLFNICWNVFLSYYSGMSIRRCVFCICWQIYKYTNNSSWQVYDNRLLHDAVKRNIQ